MRKTALIALASLGLSGCTLADYMDIRTVTVARKTQLENQVLGALQRLEDELILASSVRGAARVKTLSPLEREAVQAMMNRAFNRDDVDALKQRQVAGEANTGLLEVLALPGAPAAAADARRLVERENIDRMVVMRRVIQVSRSLTSKDLPLVQRIFHQLNRRAAQPGERVQTDDGKWVTVTAPTR